MHFTNLNSPILFLLVRVHCTWLVYCSLPSKLSVMEVIVRFTILALTSVTTPGQIVSPPVASAWLFVCRQLYKTGEGLLVLEHSDLHMHVARAWKSVSGWVGGWV